MNDVTAPFPSPPLSVCFIIFFLFFFFKKKVKNHNCWVERTIMSISIVMVVSKKRVTFVCRVANLCLIYSGSKTAEISSLLNFFYWGLGAQRNTSKHHSAGRGLVS